MPSDERKLDGFHPSTARIRPSRLRLSKANTDQGQDVLPKLARPEL